MENINIFIGEKIESFEKESKDHGYNHEMGAVEKILLPEPGVVVIVFYGGGVLHYSGFPFVYKAINT